MAYDNFRRYIWLISLLYNTGGASLKDIDLDWQDQPELNPEGTPLPHRTFNNHKTAIKEIFGFSIEYSRKDKKYHISDDLFEGRMHQVLLLMSTLSLWNRKDSFHNLSGRILYEEEPFVYPRQMQRIIAAMDNDKMIRLDYKKYFDQTVSSRELAPYCLKMFKRRWYLIAKEGNALKTFCLDNRTQGVRILDKTFEYPDDFKPEAYFKDTFGIRTAPAKKVVLKAYGLEADYLRSAPIHPSQKEIKTKSDYALFSIQVGTDAWEF